MERAAAEGFSPTSLLAKALRRRTPTGSDQSKGGFWGNFCPNQPKKKFPKISCVMRNLLCNASRPTIVSQWSDLVGARQLRAKAVVARPQPPLCDWVGEGLGYSAHLCSRLHEQQRHRSECRSCNSSHICEQQLQRSRCKKCCGSSICEHQWERNRCKQWRGNSICSTSESIPVSYCCVFCRKLSVDDLGLQAKTFIVKMI